MGKIGRGLVAGFTATVVLSVIMLIVAWTGMMPDFSVIDLWTANLSETFGAVANPVTGWLAHFLVGTVLWGLIYAGANRVLPGHRQWIKGLWFGVFAWLAMMLLFMPWAGAGIFAAQLGIVAPIATLILHLIHGWVLGYTYGRLARAETHVAA